MYGLDTSNVSSRVESSQVEFELYEAWSAELGKMKALYEEKTSTFWRNEISSSNGNSRRLWQTLQNVLCDATNDDAGDHTAEEFAAFFRDKVESVHASTMTTAPHDVRHRQTPTLECWTPVTTAEVEKLIASAPCKTCQLDPVPTWLIKDMKSLLSPFVALLAVQQISGFRPFSTRFHERRG